MRIRTFHAAGVDVRDRRNRLYESGQTVVLDVQDGKAGRRARRRVRLAAERHGPAQRHEDHTTSPMGIVGEYNIEAIKPNGCGAVDAKQHVFLNAVAARPAIFMDSRCTACRWRATPPRTPRNAPTAELLFDDDTQDRDAHGPVATKGERYVWMLDRAGNVAEVFDGSSGTRVNTVDLLSADSADRRLTWR